MSLARATVCPSTPRERARIVQSVKAAVQGMNQQTQEWPLAPAFLSPAWPLGAAANGIVPYVDGVTAGLRRLGHSPCILSVATEGGPWPDVYPVSHKERSLLSRLLDPLAFRINPQRAFLRRYSGELVAALQRV